MRYYDENASSFAEKIGVQRSSISHVLSGRNKPSLDFVMKVLKAYPDVNMYWLLNGKGNFPPEEQPVIENESSVGHNKQIFNKASTEIERIVIFYKDGSFKSFEN
jgi:transcriptional regulator with XRE-family HTH domain